MRFLALLPLALLLAACQGSQLYTPLDVQQVHQGWAEIKPDYLHFEQAYDRDDAAAITRTFKQAERDCHLPDEIDKRDTIDPNVNLFAASVALDDMCNTVETGYATWASLHGRPYDHTIVLSRPGEVFIGTDIEIKSVPKELKHPGSYTGVS